ncbi:hypothetical protein [Brucella intermedia]|uniref:hypothetical protein n=1 Tax=Brucella intermedia TaxID=94625 RepID=UPI002362BBD8|nr:hypothetical protein [Brucella intermedia]
MKVIFKIVGIYAILQLIVCLCLIVFGVIFVYGFGINNEAVKSAKLLITVIGVVSILFLLLVPAALACSRYHLFATVFPNGESRLTLAMLIALAGCLFSLGMAALKAAPMIARILSGNLHLYELLFALASVATAYIIHLFLALIGIRIGLRMIKHHLVETAPVPSFKLLRFPMSARRPGK